MRVQEFSSLAVFIAVMSNSGSSFTVVGVNNGSVNAQQAGVRRVLITPLGQTAHQPVIAKVLLKAVTKTGKKKEKVFTLRNINPSNVRSCDELRRLIKHQLSDDVIAEFDVGYVTSTRGEKVISILSTEDLLELSTLMEIKFNYGVMGLKVRNPRRRESEQILTMEIQRMTSQRRNLPVNRETRS